MLKSILSWEKLKLSFSAQCNSRKKNPIIIISTAQVFFFSFSNRISAQIVPDQSLGLENSQIHQESSLTKIEGGALRGTNLFHSFQDFQVRENQQVFFSPPVDVERIFSRVTGSNSSTILGTLGVSGAADLFFLNPNGIIFGPNARLDLQGSFLGTTADQINFADGSQFSTKISPEKPILTVNLPVGLQLGSTNGAIRVFGSGSSLVVDQQTFQFSIDNQLNSLNVRPGRTLALIGADIQLEGGNLTAESGKIELKAITEGQLSLVTGDKIETFVKDIVEYGDIQLSQAATINVSGIGSGAIELLGRRISLQEGSVIAGITEGSINGGDFTLTASEEVQLIGTGNHSRDTFTGLFLQSLGSGDTGNIRIDTKELVVQDLGNISITTLGSGQAGTLQMNASNIVEIRGSTENQLSILATQTLGSGSAGNLSINTEKLILRDGGQINTSTFGSGRAGDLQVRASESVEVLGTGIRFPSGLFTQSGRFSQGDGGNILIETKRLLIQDGAVLSASTASLGRGGEVRINASELVEVIGEELNVSGGSFLGSAAVGSGDAGSLTINTNQFVVKDGAEVTVSSVFGSFIGEGSAGNLEVNANSILLDNQGKLTAASAFGDRANITLNASNIQMRNNSQISTNAIQEATGGSITMNTDTLVALENSDITANAEQSFGGQVIINAQGIFGTRFREEQTPESDITATSERGAEFSGTVEILTPEVDPSQGLVQLSETVVDLSSLIAQGCGVAQESTFVVTGSGGLPPSPRDTLASHNIWVDLGENVSPSTSVKIPIAPSLVSASKPQLVEAQGWVRGENGNIILTATPTQVMPHSLVSTHPGCTAPAS